MISSSSSTAFPFVGLMLTGEFTLLDDPTNASGVVMMVVSLADGPDFTGSERRAEPRDPTRKLKPPIIRSIS
jgi:hypothetical protein